VAECVKRKAPDDGATVGENVEAESAARDGRDSEDADIDEFIVVSEAVVEEFLAEKTVEAGNVDVERGQLLPSLGTALARRVTRIVESARKILEIFVWGELRRKMERRREISHCAGRPIHGSEMGKKASVCFAPFDRAQGRRNDSGGAHKEKQLKTHPHKPRMGHPALKKNPHP